VKAFAAHGIDYGRELFERTYAPDWNRTYEDVGLPREAWADADARWLACYETEPSRLRPRVAETLERLAGRAQALGVVSSGDPARVRRELKALGLLEFFATVVCGGETAERKPHPEPLRVALDRLGVLPAESAYLGDSPEDVMMAKAAGAFAIGIPGGFPNRDALEASAPHLFSADLESAVSALLG
jgi:HAD superfamily hydrolase (TIGR01509 family)